MEHNCKLNSAIKIMPLPTIKNLIIEFNSIVTYCKSKTLSPIMRNYLRFLLNASTLSPVLSTIKNKIHILEDMQKLGVLLIPGQLDKEDKQDLLWICISNSSNNYRQVWDSYKLLTRLFASQDKLETVTKIWELAELASISYW